MNHSSNSKPTFLSARNRVLHSYFEARTLAQRQEFRAAGRLFATISASTYLPPDKRADAIARLGHCDWMLNRFQAAENHYKKALTLQARCHDIKGASWTELRIAELSQKKAEFSAAHSHAMKALKGFTRIHDDASVLATRQVIADTYWWECRFAEASREQERILAILDGAESSALQRGDAIHRLAEICRFRGLLYEAKEKYSESIGAYAETNRSYGAGWSLAGLADIHRMQGHFDTARRLANESLSIFNTLRFKFGIAWCTRNLGEVLRNQGYADSAEDLFKGARQLFKEARDVRGMASCDASLAEVRLAHGDFDGASRLFASAKKRLLRMRSLYAFARANRGHATALFEKAHLGSAGRMLDRSQDLFERMGNRYQVGLCSLLRGRIRAAQRDRSAALLELRRALNAVRREGDEYHAEIIQHEITRSKEQSVP